MNLIEDYFLNPAQRVYWLYMLSALILSGIYFVLTYCIRDRCVFKTQSLKNYWFHPSALLDYIYFVVNALIKVFILAPLLVSAKVVSLWIFKGLLWIKPDMMFLFFDVPHAVVVGLYSLSLFLLSDFTRYWTHRFLHTVPWLWAFHKVHHSCEVLNPLSYYRIHPVENFLFGLRYAFSTGIVTGVFLWLFGAKLGVWTIIGSNAFVFVFLLLGANLRHSHIYLYYPPWLEKWFISPAQHQLHHTAEFANKNYGGYLGFWDVLFGSWQDAATVPQPTTFGFPEKMAAPYKTLGGLLIQPFIDCKNLWSKRYEKSKKNKRF